MKSVCGTAALLVLAACGGGGGVKTATAASPDWRSVVTPGDRLRLRDWRRSWMQAFAQVSAPADRAAVAREGVLLQPDASMPPATPPLGDYRCRTVKIGAKQAGLLDYISYPAFTCRITREAGVLALAKIDGSQRPVGQLLPDDGGRLIFLGTMVLGDERRPQDYGRDAERDIAGIFERIGPDRWRLVMPSPRWESLTDVMEMVPAGR